MQFVAITQATCSWLLAHPHILTVLHQSLLEEELSGFKKSEFASGPLRIAGSEDGRVLAIWNREYLTAPEPSFWVYSSYAVIIVLPRRLALASLCLNASYM